MRKTWSYSTKRPLTPAAPLGWVPRHDTHGCYTLPGCSRSDAWAEPLLLSPLASSIITGGPVCNPGWWRGACARFPLHTPNDWQARAYLEMGWPVSLCQLGRETEAGRGVAKLQPDTWGRGDQGGTHTDNTSPGATSLARTTVVVPTQVSGDLPDPERSLAMGSGLGRVLGTHTRLSHFWGCSRLVD